MINPPKTPEVSLMKVRYLTPSIQLRHLLSKKNQSHHLWICL